MKTRSIQTLVLVLSFFVLSMGMVSAQEDDSRFYRDADYYQLTPMAVNGNFSDCGGFYHDGNLYFMSNRPEPRPWNLVRRTDDYTQAGYYMLYKSSKDSTGQYAEVNVFAKELGRKYNVGPIYITPDGQTMVVTYNMEKRTIIEQGGKKFLNHRLELYTFKYDAAKQKWSNGNPFPYNNRDYSCAHGFMSDDGQYLYFASDMPGTFGGMDIFVSKWDGNNWGVPRNLGSKVNTSYNEAFPSISKDGKYLYFSSDQPESMGGFDIYGVELPINTSREVVNLGAPINSVYDDFGLVYYEKSKQGYFASNRPLMMQDSSIAINDNIYHVVSTLTSLAGSTKRKGVADVINDNTLDIVKAMANQNTSPEFQQALEAAIQKQNATGGDFITLLEEAWDKVAPGKALADEFSDELQNVRGITGPLSNSDVLALIREESERTTPNYVLRSKLVGLVVNTIGVPVPGVAVKVTDSKGGEQIYYTNLAGQFESAPFTGGRTLTATASYKMLVSETEVIEIPSSARELRPEYAIYMELGVPKRVSMDAEVLFDYNEYYLREEAKVMLDELVDMMKAQAQVTVLLTGHTDSRGSEAYNAVLSLQRARSVAAYMIGRGIAASRIQTKGFGYAQSVNSCFKGVTCTEEEYQLNRRVEFLFSEPLTKKVQ